MFAQWVAKFRRPDLASPEKGEAKTHCYVDTSRRSAEFIREISPHAVVRRLRSLWGY